MSDLPRMSDAERKPTLPIASLAAVAASLATFAMPATAEENWVATWSASPQAIWSKDFVLPKKVPDRLRGQTVRQIARISLGGKEARITFSNEHGRTPLRIGAASIALAGNGADLVKGSLRKLTFGGRPDILIPPGAPAVSDPVALEIPDLSRLSISLYLPEETEVTTFHWDGKEDAYIAEGDRTGSATFGSSSRSDTRILLSDIAVRTENNGALVAFGDSITDGNGATGGKDSRWPDHLARRLAEKKIAVVNSGISGTRLLEDKMGENAAARFNEDVLAVPGAKSVVLMLGINDISWPMTPFAPSADLPDVDSLKQAYEQFAALARMHNLKVFGGTMPPFRGALEGTPITGYYSPEKDALRLELNDWIRKSGTFDAVLDFDVLLRDPDC